MHFQPNLMTKNRENGQKPLKMANNLKKADIWDLDPIFVRHRVWIREQWCFQDNPLQIYIPLQKLENQFSMFDMCLVFELLDWTSENEP